MATTQTLPKCETCLHWHKLYTPEFGGWCKKIVVTGREPLAPMSARIRMPDVRDIGLVTDADFGCVQHEKKS